MSMIKYLLRLIKIGRRVFIKWTGGLVMFDCMRARVVLQSIAHVAFTSYYYARVAIEKHIPRSVYNILNMELIKVSMIVLLISVGKK